MQVSGRFFFSLREKADSHIQPEHMCTVAQPRGRFVEIMFFDCFLTHFLEALSK